MKHTVPLCHKCAVNKRFRHPNTLPAWLETALGRSLVETEHRCLQPMLSGLFGPVAVQIGDAGFDSFVASSDSPFCYNACMNPEGPEHVDGCHLHCIPEQLPFQAKSVSLVILPHVLEFSDYPHQILREVDRVLVPEGHLVVLGFNPFSIWGMVGLIRRDHMPWNGRFSSLNRIKDWLTLLNFELTAGRMIYHKPPLQSKRVRQRLDFLENMGDRWWPLGAAVYAVVARKREIGITPLRAGWKKRSINPGLAKPVARNMTGWITSGPQRETVAGR